MQGKEFGAPPQQAAGAHIGKLAEDVQQIMDIFVQNGYALKVEVPAFCVLKACC